MPDLVFKSTPWRHQREALDFALSRPAVMLSMAMGTGKSKVLVDLVVNRSHQRTLIVCPIAVLGVWRREFARHAAHPVDVLVLDVGSTKDKVEAAERFMARGAGSRAIVVNYETAWRKPFSAWAMRQSWDLVTCDESHRIKSPTGKASKWLGKLRPKAGQRLCLTGTPMPHSPLDIWAQYRFLDPEIFGKSYVMFRNQYAVVNAMYPSQVRKWLHQDELGQKVASIAYQVGADVLDLPPIIHETRYFDLSAKAQRIYRGLEEDLIAEVEQGVITASNALVKLLRLQQITGGHCPEDGGNIVKVDQGKQDLLADILEDLPGQEPVVVFCRFRQDLRAVQAVAEGLGRRYGELSGERHDLTPLATMPDDIDIMGVQLQAGGVGIDLTRAAYCCYYSIGFNRGDYLQSLARTHRPGQMKTVRYYHLVASGTVDEIVYKALDAKGEIVDEVLKHLNHLNQKEPVCLTAC